MPSSGVLGCTAQRIVQRVIERQGIGINADPSWLASAATVATALFSTGIVWRNRALARMHWAHFAAPALVATDEPAQA